MWKHHQLDNGNISFQKQFRYDTWRMAWYAFLELLDIDVESYRAQTDFQCPSCGLEPEIIVCDATSLGFQRKYAMLAFKRNEPLVEEIIKRTS